MKYSSIVKIFLFREESLCFILSEIHRITTVYAAFEVFGFAKQS